MLNIKEFNSKKIISKGQPAGKKSGPLKKGYNNKPTWRD